MDPTRSLEVNGFALLRGVVNAAECDGLRAALGEATGAGTRGILKMPEVAEFARTRLADLVRHHLRQTPLAVRGIYFDKRPESNWLVAWHQDLTIAVSERAEVPGFGPWSTKDEVPHVQPPTEALEQMLTARLHLDAADVENGALRVIPGTHALGRLNASAIQQCRQAQPEVLCEAEVGDVLLMRPLLLHASSRSTTERRRRILHVEFAGFELPSPLRWHESPV